MDAEEIKKQAQDENTPSEILVELAKSKDKEILRAIAGNPNTPVEVLETLGAEFPDTIVNNPIFDLLLLENPESKFVLLSLARASTTSVEKLKELANYPNMVIVDAVVKNLKTPTNIIDNIYKNNRYYLPDKIFLNNKNTGGATLEIVAIKTGATNEEINNLIINHPNVFFDTINAIKLCNGYLDIPPYVLHSLLNHKNKNIVRLIVNHPNITAEILKELSLNGDGEIRRAVAKHPNTSQDVLHSLARYTGESNHGIRCIIAARKDISDETIIMLADDFALSDYRSCYIKEKLASNPIVKKSVINNLIEDEHHRVRAAITAREDISEEQTMMLAYDLSDLVRKKLADNPKVSNAVKKLLNTFNQSRKSFIHTEKFKKKQLARKDINELPINAIDEQNIRKKARSEKHFLRLKLSTITIISTSAIKQIINNSEHSFLLGLTNNINSPPEILEILATDENYLVRQNVANHPKATLDTLNKLKTDENINVREKVAANSNISLEIIKELAQDSMAAVRQAIVNNPHTTTAILNELQSDHSDCVRGAIAMGEDISKEMAVALADDASAYVRQRLVCNPNVPVEIIELLSKDIDLISKDGNSLVQLEMIRNIDLSPKLFENLALSSAAKVRTEVARHPKAPLSVLDRLKMDEDKYVRVEVAKNPNISLAIMEYLAKDSINSKPTSRSCLSYGYRVWTDYHHQVRLAIAANTQTPETILNKLKSDHNLFVRRAVAENYNTSIETLKELLNDEAPKIIESAKDNLIKRQIKL